MKNLSLKQIKEDVDDIMLELDKQICGTFLQFDHIESFEKVFITTEAKDKLRKLRAAVYGLMLEVAASHGIEIPELKKKSIPKYRKPKGKKNGLDRRTAKTSLR
jgi:hypothetical protein